MGSSSQAPPARASRTRQHRQAPYMMQGMAVPPLTRANPNRRGIAHDICPRTPPRVQVEFDAEQRQYPRCPRLARP